MGHATSRFSLMIPPLWNASIREREREEEEEERGVLSMSLVGKSAAWYKEDHLQLNICKLERLKKRVSDDCRPRFVTLK